MPLPELLRTGRLTLRQLTAADLPVLVREIGRWEVAQWLIHVPHPYSMADGESWLEITRARRGTGTLLHFAAVPEGGAEMIGAIGLDMAAGGEGEAELGYWLSPAFWGQGLGTEMAQAMVACGFRDVGLSAIEAAVDPMNQASNNVLRKAGFRMVQVDPLHHRGLRGGPAPANIHRITRTAFEANHDHA